MPFQHVALAVLVASLWGFFPLACKMIAGDCFPPIMMSGLRFLGASVPLIFFVKRPKASFGRIFLISLTLALNTLLFMIGVRSGVGPGLISILMESQAFFTVILAAILFGHRLRFLQMAALLLCFSGIVFIGQDMGLYGGHREALVILLISAFLWAVNNLQMACFPKKESFLGALAWINFLPALPLLGVSYVYEKPLFISALEHFSFMHAGLIFFVSFVNGIVGLGAWFYLLNHNKPAQVAPFALLSPFVAVLSGALLFEESFTQASIIGGSLIIAGLVALQVFRRFSPRR